MSQREYVVAINGIAHTVLLDDEQVKRYPSAHPVEKPAKAAPTKARTAPNKARTAANKSGNAG